MKRAAEIFSKFIFWCENFLYLKFFLAYELLLCPFILLKVSYNIMRGSTFINFFPMFFFWIIVGPLFLIFAVLKDLFYLMKILCEYNEDEDQFKEKEEEDFK